MKKIDTLGVFDSGLGGYSVYHYLKTQFPQLNLVLYADQKNAPYGNQTQEAITSHSQKALDWFSTQNINHVLIACNTVCSGSIPELKEAHPTMEIMGIIDLTVSKIQNKKQSVAVVSTNATHRSHAYINELRSQGFKEIKSKPLPELVNLIETLKPVDAYLAEELEELLEYDALILGCTHYPLVIQQIQSIFKGEVLDSREAIADEVRKFVMPELGNGFHKIYTTGSSIEMKKQLKVLFNIDEEVEAV